MRKILPLGLILGLVVLAGCAGILPCGGESYDPQPGCIGIENPSPATAHIMIFEASSYCGSCESSITSTTNSLLFWERKSNGSLSLKFRKSPILFDENGYMEGINKSSPYIWKMIIRPQVLQNTAVQILHLIPDRRYTLVAYFTYAVSNNLIPINSRMFWSRSFYVPAELRAHRDSLGEVTWLSAFIRLPRVNTQVIHGRLCPQIEIQLP